MHNTLFIKEAQDHDNIQKLESFLMGVTGVERVLIDTDDGEIKVEYDEQMLDLVEITKLINDQGFHIQ
ncbi:copper chaperone CopZ [Salirhabdus euzebyi]|uniref:Copper chaperone CopZ n=1 Tax=Salirhabdus euzebyi TaxID=394506 RepID=A0A841Q4L8_9BACI|nr:heavy metal-associated domain-containing protein [Salirhabdus euzebyi]MBB6453356.1 copper chaperone CopZ [Salirhabdus euzebyi]